MVFMIKCVTDVCTFTFFLILHLYIGLYSRGLVICLPFVFCDGVCGMFRKGGCHAPMVRQTVTCDT